MRVYVARHGHTELNGKDQIRGWSEATLDECGKLEAKRLAKEFKDIKFDVIYCSDLERAFETASAIRKFQPQAQMKSTMALRTMNFGKLQGVPREEVEDQVDALFRSWESLPWIPAPGGESIADFQGRLHTFIEQVLNASEHETILIVTHMRVINYLIGYIMNNEQPLYGDRIRILARGGAPVDAGNYMIVDWQPNTVIRRLNVLDQEPSENA